MSRPWWDRDRRKFIGETPKYEPFATLHPKSEKKTEIALSTFKNKKFIICNNLPNFPSQPKKLEKPLDPPSLPCLSLKNGANMGFVYLSITKYEILDRYKQRKPSAESSKLQLPPTSLPCKLRPPSSTRYLLGIGAWIN